MYPILQIECIVNPWENCLLGLSLNTYLFYEIMPENHAYPTKDEEENHTQMNQSSLPITMWEVIFPLTLALFN